MSTSHDVEVQNEGSILIFWLKTDAVTAWVGEHVATEYQVIGSNGMVVEPRYAADLIKGLRDAGFEVK